MLTVTDADRVELSNLTRQFLFREDNVTKPKSTSAAARAKTMNPAIKVKALEMFVGTKTEDTFNDSFWSGMDGICNALDNMEARFYVDGQCVKYEKPLLESGTMGPAGNIDPVVPYKTQTYKDGGQADEGGGIPMCTLRNFPHLPDHCIEWGRDQFALLFVKLAKQAKSFTDGPDAFISEKRGSSEKAQAIFEVRGLMAFLSAVQSPSVKSAGQLSFDFFHLLFRDKIKDLTAAFPADARTIDKDTKQDKGPFWSGHKRFPQCLDFDVSNPSHWKYQVATTALFAQVIGLVKPKQEDDNNFLKDWRSQSWCAEQVKDLKVPEYVAGAVNTEGDDSGNKGNQTNPGEILDELLQKLEAFKGMQLPNLEEADFEKDDDFNFHIEFITYVANLRADNYYISNSDFHKVKLVAGRIVPAIATTTAAVCGLVMLEMFKVVAEKPSDKLRTRQVGLAVNNYVSFEANEPKYFRSGEETITPKASDLPENAFDENGKIKDEFKTIDRWAAYPNPHSVWDRIKLPNGTMSMLEFKEWMKTEHKLTLKNWSIILGWKKEEDDEGKEMKVSVSAQVFPPPKIIDASNLPALDLTQPAALQAIQKNAAIGPADKMRYFGEWQKAKNTGQMPAAPTDVVTGDMSLKDMLFLMEKKASAGLEAGTINPKWGKAISGLEGRAFWMISGDQTPLCETIPEGDAEALEVRFLCSLCIPLS